MTKMKRVTAMAGLLLLAAGAGQAQYKYTITGHVEHIPTARHIYMAKNWRDMSVRDTIPVVNGKFTYSGVTDGPDPVMGFLFIGHNDETKGGVYRSSMITDFYIEKGHITIDIKGLGFRDSAIIGGTPANVDYRGFTRVKKAGDQQVRVLMDSLKAANVADKEINLQYKAAVRDCYLGFVKAHPNSFISLQLLSLDLWKVETPEHIAGYMKELSPALQESPAANTLKELLKSAMLIRLGMTAPEFTEKDTTGVPVALSSFRGRYVLVDFWASWCHPCRAESPYLIKAYEAYKDKNFTIVSVSMDNSKKAWLKAIHDDHLPWQQLSALDPNNSESAIKYGVKSIPRNFLIDPDGKIIAMDMRMNAVSEKLKEVLN